MSACLGIAWVILKQQLSKQVLMRTSDFVLRWTPIIRVGPTAHVFVECECVLCPFVFKQLGHSQHVYIVYLHITYWLLS